MGNRIIRVTLAPGHEVSLTSDAPDIDALVKEIVKVRDMFKPDQVKVHCDYDGFDEASFQEVVAQSASDFIDTINLDKKAYDNALKDLKNACDKSSEATK